MGAGFEPLSRPTKDAPGLELESAWEPKTPQDKSFWASMIAADKRLADLRRVIDQVAADADAQAVPPISEPGLGERRHAPEEP